MNAAILALLAWRPFLCPVGHVKLPYLELYYTIISPLSQLFCTQNFSGLVQRKHPQILD